MNRRGFWLSGLILLSCGAGDKTETAWRRLRAALSARNDPECIRAGEKYLLALGSKDLLPARTAQVRRAYRRAFVRWAASVSPAPDREAAMHLARFKKWPRPQNLWVGPRFVRPQLPPSEGLERQSLQSLPGKS